jgi:predicted O-linked N-acetylglucosamine transferase (SPINDLY family)
LQSDVGSRAFRNARLQKQFKKQAKVLLPTAIEAYRRGKQSEVQVLCRQILKDLPDHFDALHLLGVSELDCRQFEAVALKPNFPAALTNLGNVLMRLGFAEQAVAAHDRAIEVKPDYGDAYCNRGMALLLLNRNDQADQNFERALSLQRRHLQAMAGKGLVSLGLNHYDAALTAFNAALAIRPDAAEVLVFRGRLYQQIGQFVQAEADFDAALAFDPMLEVAWEGKAAIRILSGDVAQAIAAAVKALELNPASATAIMLLGACYARQGDIETAVEHYDRALDIKPDYEVAIAKKIFALDFAPDADFTIHQAARRTWWERIGAGIPRRQLQSPMPNSKKRIVVGYVSSDFRSHSAAHAFMPVLRYHDRREFEIICYSCSPLRDAVTEECRSLVDIWVDACQLSDDELADRIQSDGVDILVDLSGHSAGNRLTVFARKPAPIQVTAWGNATGTGLSTMDYFFSDPVTVPEAVRHLFVERIYDLPCLITTEGLPNAQPSTLPMVRSGHVTFGVFNRIDKISEGALAIWSKLLQQVEGSTILIKNGALDDPFLRDGLIGRSVAHGISPDRVRCLGSSSRHEHIAEFANVDISLDPFPQNGGVSTWESLQAGVPVVTRLGKSASSRVGAAIVKAVGLDGWVADDDDGYVAIARKYASMPSHLEALRAGLPARLAVSEAGNGAIYAGRVEEGYRQFWRDYCASMPQPADEA